MVFILEEGKQWFDLEGSGYRKVPVKVAFRGMVGIPQFWFVAEQQFFQKWYAWVA